MSTTSAAERAATERAQREAIYKLTPEQLAHERLCVLECAITALIATHPDKDRVRRIFDALLARHEVSRAKAGAPIGTASATDGLIEMFFHGVARG